MKELYMIFGVFLMLSQCNAPKPHSISDYRGQIDSVLSVCLPLSDSAGAMDVRLKQIENAILKVPKRATTEREPVIGRTAVDPIPYK